MQDVNNVSYDRLEISLREFMHIMLVHQRRANRSSGYLTRGAGIQPCGGWN
jgi:hypothetical protein